MSQLGASKHFRPIKFSERANVMFAVAGGFI